MNAGAEQLRFRHPGFKGRIGIARGDITPPVQIYARNWGAAPHDQADSIHRPLTLTAMVIEDASAGQRLVFIEGDLSWWRELATWRDFQCRLLHAIQVPPEALIFSLTHSHASPPLAASNPQLAGGELLGCWVDKILNTSIELVAEAVSRLEEAVLEWHHGTCQLAQNRDFPEPGSAGSRYVCGYHPAAAADHTLLVGRVANSAGRIRALLVNYACHPTTLAFDNHSISPDFVGAMRATIERNVPGAAAMFLQGASGELAPRYQYVGDPAVADRHGRQLGYAALATLEDMQSPGEELVFDGVVESGAPLAVWRPQSRDLSTGVDIRCIPIRVPLKQWPTSEQLLQASQQCQDRAKKERLVRQLAIRRSVGDADHYELSFWIWRVGESIWVGSMAESYSLLQTALRDRFPQVAVVCQNLVNGSIGYLSPAHLYDQNIYQVWQTPFAQGALEMVLDRLTFVIRDLLEDTADAP